MTMTKGPLGLTLTCNDPPEVLMLLKALGPSHFLALGAGPLALSTLKASGDPGVRCILEAEGLRHHHGTTGRFTHGRCMAAAGVVIITTRHGYCMGGRDVLE